MLLVDEYGSPWLVEKGDPAYDPARKMLQLGFSAETVVLPQGVLLFGSDALADYQLPVEPVAEDEEFLRWCWLVDGLQALQNSATIGGTLSG